MAAPPVTARITPTGFKVPEGFKSTVAYSKQPGINLFETTPSLAGLTGTKINVTDQFAVRFHRKVASGLIDVDDVPFEAGYDPDVYDTLIGMIGDWQNSAFSVHIPDGSTTSYWGFLLSAKPQPFRIGQWPLLNCVNTISNYDSATKTEQGPVTTQAAGT